MNSLPELKQILDHIMNYQAEVLLGLSVAMTILLLFLIIVLVRVRRLRERSDELAKSVKSLLNDQEARYTRELLKATKDKALT